MSKKLAKIVFTPSGRRGEFPVGTSVLEAARNLGVDIDSICGGRGLCGRCQITCSEGDFPKHQIISHKDHLSAISDTERTYNKCKKPLAQARRLGCHTCILDDVVIDVPAESQVHKQIIRKHAEQREIILDPAVQLYYINVAKAGLDNADSDLTRLLEALEQEWQLCNLSWDTSLLQSIQPVLRKENWSITVAVYANEKIIAVWPGFKDQVYGIAFDIGSTTIAAHLCDLNTGEVINSTGMMNPQIRFGEDLMSRVSYVMMHPEGSNEMTIAVRQGINQLISQVCEESQISPEDIIFITLVGNPIMHHLLLGIDPSELGGAPFALAIDEAVEQPARDIDIKINSGAMSYILPCIAGHVGADTAAVILSEQPYLKDDINLLIDIGTNAEIVLGNKERLLACSSPTGPAFEGAQLSCGQRAAAGAIERVRIDPNTFTTKFKVIGSDLWSDEPGFNDAISAIGVTGICGSGVIEAIAEMYLAGIVNPDGVIDGTLKTHTDNIVATDRTWSYVLYDQANQIQITQNDVRQIQLAKAALYAGIKLLMDKMQISSVDNIRLCGAFGSHIDIKYAMILGLIPDCVLDNVTAVGNAAGTGARIALLNFASRTEIESIVKQVEKIETATEEKFQDYFVDAMAIPHKSDDFLNLFSVIKMPIVKSNTITANIKKRRRRKV